MYLGSAIKMDPATQKESIVKIRKIIIVGNFMWKSWLGK